MKTPTMIVTVFALISIVLTACNTPVDPTQTTPVEPTQNPAFEPTRALLDGDYISGHQGEITGLDVVILESFPVQVRAQVSGYFTDGCVELVDITIEREDDGFILTLNTRRPAGDVACTQALVPFDEAVMLDVVGLPAGTYTVAAGDMRSEFVLDVDNTIQEEPISCPEPGEGEVSFQAVDREAGVDFCFLIPDNFVQEESEEERTWVLAGPEVAGEGVKPALIITLFPMDGQSFEVWVDMQSDQLKLPQGNFDDQIMLYQGIALDIEDWNDQTGARVQWIPAGEYVFRLVFSPLDAKNFPQTTEALETLYGIVMGSWVVPGE